MAERATVDFDHHDPDFHQHRHDEWAKLRGCPVAHNSRFGGFWAVSGYDEVATVSRDAETFSSRHSPEAEDDIEWLGIAGVPRSRAIPTAGIAEVEGPLHLALRRVLNPHLVPAAVAALEPRMETIASWFLDQHIASGHIDLVLDFANPVPAIVTMELIGLPATSWQHYADLFHATVAHRPGQPEYDDAVANIGTMLTELAGEVDARREQPRDDLLSALVQLDVDGRAMTDDELVAVLWNLIGGGLDTTTSLTSLSLLHLDADRDLRQRLVDHPELLAPATEEFLRFFSVNETLTRTVTRDVDLGGQQLRRGDHLLLSWLSANRDERVFDRPDDVVVDREPNPHLAFGVGVHRCIGMHLARTLFQVLVRQVLARLPDYQVDRSATQLYAGNPTLNGVVRMPATFSPGPLFGPAERPF